MKVFVAGATGVLGRRAVRELVASGHTVTAIARTPEKAELVSRLGAVPATLSLFDADDIARVCAPHDAICNLATRIPSPTNTSPDAWRENDRIRSVGSRILTDAAIANGITRFVQESISFLYADGGDAWIDENVALDVMPGMSSVLDAEANARRLSDGVVLRFGLFVSDRDSYTDFAIARAERGKPVALGSPDAYISPVHADDAAAAVVAALDAEPGTYNVCVDEPPTRRAYTDALTDAFGIKRVALHAQGSGYLARSHRISNRRFRAASGWAPRYADATDLWGAVARDRLG
jgi:nucleoside-diphosphate-sugar epimerase